jgi:hypothetical protein
MKLNQLIAILQSVKANATKGKTEVYVPVPCLLFLEKQLQDVKTFVLSLPVLSINKDWQRDPNRGCYVTTPK